MKRLDNNMKRGRPDITHFALLEALGSPLNKEGLLQVYVHTVKDYVITVNSTARLPKNYNRFIGLIEQLFQQGQVPTDKEPLLTLEQKTLKQLLTETKTDHVLAFSKKGKPKTIQDAVSVLHQKQRPAVVVGGFPHGHFSETTAQLLDEVVCVDPEMLETWTMTSRIIYEFERTFSIPAKRLKPR
jgi:rRNA small subunit pseudouridine methyltransferase Nep1